MSAFSEKATDSVESGFDRNWGSRKEAHYNHWTLRSPRNQIQLAFRQHWLSFQRHLDGLPGDEVLEVGCGRGTIGSYFANAGHRVTLLDSSPAVIDIARSAYQRNGHTAQFVIGDGFALPFDGDRFAVCVSIGLLEHFDDVGGLMREQLRVLQPGGVMLAYVVPERPDNVQRYFDWLNSLLKGAMQLGRRSRQTDVKAIKEPLYRNELTSADYVDLLNEIGVSDVETYGMYPLPMISHSPEFPFSLLPWPLERLVVGCFSAVLAIRQAVLRRDPWMCREKIGQAFLVMARKRK